MTSGLATSIATSNVMEIEIKGLERIAIENPAEMKKEVVIPYEGKKILHLSNIPSGLKGYLPFSDYLNIERIKSRGKKKIRVNNIRGYSRHHIICEEGSLIYNNFNKLLTEAKI